MSEPDPGFLPPTDSAPQFGPQPEAPAGATGGEPASAVPTGYYVGTHNMTRTSEHAVAALVLGIAGLFLSILGLPLLALYFGIRARREIALDSRVKGEGMATAGIVLGAIGVLVMVAVIASLAR